MPFLAWYGIVSYLRVSPFNPVHSTTFVVDGLMIEAIGIQMCPSQPLCTNPFYIYSKTTHVLLYLYAARVCSPKAPSESRLPQ